jgi:CopG family nickel-responsive transcriptional regulator
MVTGAHRVAGQTPAIWTYKGRWGKNDMADLVRTGVSFERDLLASFDEAITRKGYRNRSEAIRDLIRAHLVEQEADENKTIVGTLTVVYDHQQPNLSEKLIDAQHHAKNQVLAATHVHLDHHNCLEVVIMKGLAGEVQHLADHILSLKGVKHGKLAMTSTGKEF